MTLVCLSAKSLKAFLGTSGGCFTKDPPGAAGSSVCLLKLGWDETTLYTMGVTLFGVLAIGDVGVPISGNVLPQLFAEWEVAAPEFITRLFMGEEEGEERNGGLPLDGVVTLALGVGLTLIYWAPVAMTQKYLVSNAIAWAIAMVTLGAVSLGSFQTAATLLMGLFAYDIFWVFGTDVMMTVATKVEAPVKFLYAAPPSAPETPRIYDFSVLGLGDVVIPGLFVRFMSKVDEILKPATFSYFGAATAAYAFGLTVCFIVNEITHAGQPALLYLDPACLGSALAVGAVNGQLGQVWNFEEPDDDSDD